MSHPFLIALFMWDFVAIRKYCRFFFLINCQIPCKRNQTEIHRFRIHEIDFIQWQFSDDSYKKQPKLTKQL